MAVPDLFRRYLEQNDWTSPSSIKVLEILAANARLDAAKKAMAVREAKGGKRIAVAEVEAKVPMLDSQIEELKQVEQYRRMEARRMDAEWDSRYYRERQQARENQMRRMQENQRIPPPFTTIEGEILQFSRVTAPLVKPSEKKAPDIPMAPVDSRKRKIKLRD